MTTLSVSHCGTRWWYRGQCWQFFTKALVLSRVVVLLPLMNERQKRWVWVWWFQLSPAQQCKLRRQLQRVNQPMG